jgi:hypothetical protein
MKSDCEINVEKQQRRCEKSRSKMHSDVSSKSSSQSHCDQPPDVLFEEHAKTLRAKVSTGSEAASDWVALAELADSITSRNAILTALFKVGDGAIASTIMRNTADLRTQREKFKFFRDASFRRDEDELPLRHIMREQVLHPLCEFVLRTIPSKGIEGIFLLAATAVDNLMFDAESHDIRANLWSSFLGVAQRWKRAIHSLVPLCVVARMLQFQDTVTDTEADVMRELITPPPQRRSQYDAKCVARIGVGFHRLQRPDNLLRECRAWLERRGTGPRGDHANEDTAEEVELFALVGLTSRGKRGADCIASYGEALTAAVRAFFCLAPTAPLAELYCLKVNLRSIWVFQTFLTEIETPPNFARVFWVGCGPPIPTDVVLIEFIVLLTRFGVKPEVACHLLEDADDTTQQLLVGHDGASEVACSLVANAQDPSDVLVSVAATRLRQMVSDFPHLHTTEAYRQMVDNECRREDDMAYRGEHPPETTAALVSDRSDIINCIGQDDRETARRLADGRTVSLRHFKCDDSEDSMAQAMRRELAGEPPGRIWMHATIRHHVSSTLEGINLGASGHQRTDFGRGFYLLTDVYHAASAAKQSERMATRAPLGDVNPPSCAVVVYRLVDKAGQDLLGRNGLTFAEPSSVWQNVVRLFRTLPNDKPSKLELANLKRYDYIQGPVAVLGTDGTWTVPLPLAARGAVRSQLAIKSQELAFEVDANVLCVWFFETRVRRDKKPLRI